MSSSRRKNSQQSAREIAAANLISLQVDNNKLRNSYYKDLNDGNISEHKLAYPPKISNNNSSVNDGNFNVSFSNKF